MRLCFGTDGLRGTAGADLTPELLLALGRALGAALQPGGRLGSQASGRPELLIGRDTRWSGPLLQAALAAGAASEGVDVVDLGVLPTPGVAAVAEARGLAGAVVSASHNPFPDNGVKIFAPGGLKLPAAVEAGLEADVAELLGLQLREGPVAAGRARTGTELGRLGRDREAGEWYRSHLLEALEGRTLAGARVVLDCGNGAAAATAPEVLASAGAEVVEVLGGCPDGTNINEGCGSTDPSALGRAVVASRADLGLAFDGDADRMIAVDGDGATVDGDRLLAMFAADLHQRGRLRGATLVVTVMSNEGLRIAMERLGIAVHRTPVGDRNVLEALDSGGWSLGGEQSGHIIFRDLATTGDGILSGLLLADLLLRRCSTLAELARSAMDPLPQVLRNVAVADPAALAGAEGVWSEVSKAEAELGGEGRVLLRRSGTEPVVRVMVEARSPALASVVAGRLEAAVRSALGEPPGREAGAATGSSLG